MIFINKSRKSSNKQHTDQENNSKLEIKIEEITNILMSLKEL